MNFPLEFREKVIAEGLSSGKSYRVLAEEFGVGYSTLGKWLRDYRNSGEQPLAKKEKRPQDWSIEQRFDAVLETQQLSEEEVGRWCREHGLHTHQLSRWRQDAMAGTAGGKKATAEQSETRRLREENRSLKKELRRKDKALAETAALLVLKKKAEAIWGEPEDD